MAGAQLRVDTVEQAEEAYHKWRNTLLPGEEET